MTTSQVMDFLSSDFMPVGAYAGTAPVDGAIDTVLIQSAGAGLPANKTGASALYAPILGDGTGGIVKFETDGSGTLTSIEVEAAGSGYTYGSVALVTGTGSGGLVPMHMAYSPIPLLQLLRQLVELQEVLWKLLFLLQVDMVLI